MTQYLTTVVDPFKYGIPQIHPFMGKAIALDIESTVPVPTKVDPYLPGCEPFMVGHAKFAVNGAAEMTYTGQPDFDYTKLLIGHNIKFDLALMRRYNIKPWKDIPKGMMVWDTQFAHYLMTGQRDKWPSLDDVAKYWNLAVKPFSIGEALQDVEWDISKVPFLNKYLCHDTRTTLLIAAKQWEHPIVKDNLSWYLAMMDGLMGTFEMEYNGYAVDMNMLRAKEARGLTELNTQKKNYEEACFKALIEDHDLDEETATKVVANSSLGGPKFLKPFIFGGRLDYVTTEAVPTKTGKMRNRRVKRFVELKLAYLPKPWYKNVSGNIKLDVNVISDLVHNRAASYIQEALQILLRIRLLTKTLATYIKNVAENAILDPQNGTLVHPNVNLCATATGRTSSSNPNMQNNPAHDILDFTEIFASSWYDGYYMEVDFKQLEVVWLAYLSRDPILMDDLRHNVDIHSAIGAMAYGKGVVVTKERRKRVKRVVFGMIYGGGIKTLAEQSGLPETVVKKIINSFYARYPSCKNYFEGYRHDVMANGIVKGTGQPITTPIGTMAGVESLMPSVTGRHYNYTYEYDQYANILMPPYTATRNYPIQGIATGDFMLNVIGIIWRTICQERDDWKLVGLIHDSLIFDCKSLDVVRDLKRRLEPLLKNAGVALTKRCPKMLDFDLPIEVEFTCGKTLGSLKPMEN